MTNDDLKRFYESNINSDKPYGFVRYDGNGELPGGSLGVKNITLTKSDYKSQINNILNSYHILFADVILNKTVTYEATSVVVNSSTDTIVSIDHHNDISVELNDVFTTNNIYVDKTNNMLVIDNIDRVFYIAIGLSQNSNALYLRHQQRIMGNYNSTTNTDDIQI